MELRPCARVYEDTNNNCMRLATDRNKKGYCEQCYEELFGGKE